MKYFRLKIVLTVILTVILVSAFSWTIIWLNHSRLVADSAEEKPLNREAVNYTLENLTESWNEYEKKITTRYEVEAVLSSYALRNVEEGDKNFEEQIKGNRAVVSTQNGELSSGNPVIGSLGLDASLFSKRTGSFAAPNDPTTFVVYSRIGDSDRYYVEWYEDTVIDDIVAETIDIPGILKRTEIAYNVSAIFLSKDPESGEITGIPYKDDRYFSNCSGPEDLGLSRADLEKDDANSSGTIRLDVVSFSYVSGESAVPPGYVILLEQMPDLYTKAFGQAGYMIAALIVLLTGLITAGFSLYSYVHNNILTPEQEKNCAPAHVRSLTSLYGIIGVITIAVTGMFIYALSGMYDNVARGKERLSMMDESISNMTDRYSQNIQSFKDIYTEFGTSIAQFLDTYPELRDSSILAALADSISASSITLYDADGNETISSSSWRNLRLGTNPGSTTYEFRRILNGAPSVIHDLETDEQTGLYEMRLGLRIRDDKDEDRFGVMMLSVDIPELTNHDIDPEKAVREILQNLSDAENTLWIADAKTGRILLSGDEEMEGGYISELGLGETDLKGNLNKAVETENGAFFVTSAYMDTPDSLAWTNTEEGIIAYCKGPETSLITGMLLLALTGCALFCVIYTILAWILFRGYTDEYFNTYKHIKGSGLKPKKAMGRIRKALSETTPGRRGLIAMEIATAFAILMMYPVVKTDSLVARNTVYFFISAGDWERGFNLFALAAIVLLLLKVILFVIAIRLVLGLCSVFSGSKGKTIFRLLANVVLYVSLFFFLIKACEFLGFSPTAIAAGMGSLALAISLGAQNFVSDIFAGLTFVFEGTVHVGDTIQLAILGGFIYEGEVLEIGVRCIKLLTREGDLITCPNREIKTIKNSTQMNSHVICEIEVSSKFSADEIEQMLKDELPNVGSTDRKILNGPFYNGITAIGSGTMTLSFSVECKEEDFSYVKDKINSSLLRIFRDHGYTL